MDAARCWAGYPDEEAPDRVDPSVLVSLEIMDAPDDVLAAVRARASAAAAPAGHEVWPENWATVRLFCAMGTQWHWVTGGMSAPSRAGLRYEAIPIAARGCRIRRPLRLLPDLQLMERAVLSAQADHANNATRH